MNDLLRSKQDIKEELEEELAGWCFGPSQPPRIISRLEEEEEEEENHTWNSTLSTKPAILYSDGPTSFQSDRHVFHSVLPVLILPYWSFQLYISLRKSPSAFVVDWA